MKPIICSFIGTAAVLGAVTVFADTPSHLRVVRSQPSVAYGVMGAFTAAEPAMPDRKQTFFRHFGGEPLGTENVTFLGVETMPVSATLISQLNLPDHAGLVVLHVSSGSPAAAALKEHDILLKLDDQILIDQQQLSVLIRNHKDNDEVTLTFMRGGKQETAKVKLTRRDVPKMSGGASAKSHLFELFDGENPEVLTESGADGKVETNHMLSLIRPSAGREPLRIEIDRPNGPGVRALSVNTGNSNLVYSDEKGSLEVTTKDGKKTLVAKNAKGEREFSGPVNTPEEQKAMPADVRERFEKLESMQDVTFETDGDFEGTETHVVSPEVRPIVMPHRPASSPMVRYGAF